MITAQPIVIEDINRVITNVFGQVAHEEGHLVVAALLTMVIMATYPDLEGDQLIETVENASQLLLTLGTANTVAN